MLASALWVALGFGSTSARAASDIHLNLDADTDVLWYDAATGGTGAWLMNGAVPSAMSGLLTDPHWQVTHVGDFDGDGMTDLLWYNATMGQTGIWLMNGLSVKTAAGFMTDPTRRVTQVGDFDGDGRADLIIYEPVTGETTWCLSAASGIGCAEPPRLLRVDPNWVVAFTGRFFGRPERQLLWVNNATGDYEIWLLSGHAGQAWSHLTFSFPTPGNPWRITHVGDFDGDGYADFIWRNPSTGETSAWLVGNSYIKAFGGLMSDPQWAVTQVADLDGDGKADLIWYNATTGATGAWLMNGLAPKSVGGLMTSLGWSVVGIGDFNGDGAADLLWRNDTVGTGVWLMNGLTPITTTGLMSDPAWSVVSPP
jgi:hypothetical protein